MSNLRLFLGKDKLEDLGIKTEEQLRELNLKIEMVVKPLLNIDQLWVYTEVDSSTTCEHNYVYEREYANCEYSRCSKCCHVIGKRV